MFKTKCFEGSYRPTGKQFWEYSGGPYSLHIHAKTAKEAEKVAEGLRVEIVESIRPHGMCDCGTHMDPRPSHWYLRYMKEHETRLMINALHAVVFLGWWASRFGLENSNTLLKDDGIIHGVLHSLLDDLATPEEIRESGLIENLQKFEKRVPGFPAFEVDNR